MGIRLIVLGMWVFGTATAHAVFNASEGNPFDEAFDRVAEQAGELTPRQILDEFDKAIEEAERDVPNAAALWDENRWSDWLVEKYVRRGRREVKLPDGRRVDILTEKVAWEVDWVGKWEEGIGQSLGYAIATQRDPGLWLLKPIGDDSADESYNQALGVVTLLRAKGIPIQFRVTSVPKTRPAVHAKTSE